MYFVKIPDVIKPFSGDLIWNLERKEKVVYLTFDDGPTEHITGQILEILSKYEALATFFCIGGNVMKHPERYQQLIDSGHAVGNHTWNHMSGWEFSDFAYYRSALDCSKVVHSNLFRPPYGRISRSQAKGLSKRYRIIMWDVLSADYHPDVTPEKCLSNVTKNVQPGSIVVFHDSEKAKQNMLFALPRALKHLSEEGYRFAALN